jgi:dipeptidyl aminopeptidase/acylaminoacyl peptidase
LYIHGGPAAQYGRVFFHEFQVLAARGYVVFYTNPRGGTGYSEKHLNAIVNRWGTVDYDDLMTFTDVALRKARHLDRRRLAVGGGSYGGFMTNWIIGHTGRFACAITSRSISNLMSFIGSSDFGYAWPQEFGSRGPWHDPHHYLKMSPLTYLERMKTPTLIEHQEEDHRCPVEQAEQLWAALKTKGVPVEFLRYPGEPHGMSRGGRPDRRIDRMERILAWLERWTKR